MEDFMKAMAIFQKYMKEEVYAPFNCSHDEMHFYGGFDPSDVSEEDITELDRLGWFESEYEGFMSFRFGSC